MGGRQLIGIGLLLSLGCSDAPGPGDAGRPDGGPPDSGRPDSGPTILWKDTPGGENGAVLSVLDAGAWFLAPDNGWLAWSSTDGVFETERSTGETRQLIFRESLFDTPLAIVVDDAGVYWTALDDRVRRLDRATGTVTVVGTTVRDTAALAVSGGLLIVGDASGITIRPTDGGGPAVAFEVGGAVSTLVVDRSEGFASVLPSRGGFDLDIVRFELDGQAELIAQFQPSGQVLGVDESYVYWGTGDRSGDGGALVRALRAGGPVETLAVVDLPVAAGVVDGPRVYFTTFQGALQAPPMPPQALRRYDATTGITTRLATGLFSVLEVVTTPEGLYFGEQGRRLDRIAPLP